MSIKKRPSGEAEAGKAAKKGTTKGPARPSAASGTKRTPRPVGGAKAAPRPATGRPRIRASHAAPSEVPAPKKRVARAPAREGGEGERPAARPVFAARGEKPAVRKAPLGAPKRPGKRSLPPETAYEASAASRELAVALAAAGIEKKAIGIEILDVSGKVDYADFLVVMTGRSDRHVHAIAMGLDEAMRKRKVAPLSVEGLTAATWVLLDFGDVVVHVFQEEARALYDIEGLWIDANRVPVPADIPNDAAAKAPVFD